MHKQRTKAAPLLTPAAVLALVAVAPLVLASEAAYRTCPTRSAVIVGTADQAETLVQYVNQAAREFFKPHVVAAADVPTGFIVELRPYLFTSYRPQAAIQRGFDLPLALTDLPPPL